MRPSDPAPRGAGSAAVPGATHEHYPLLFSPYRLAGRTLRNRIMHAAMTTRYSVAGRINQRVIDYHANRARGGAGLVVSEALSGIASMRNTARVDAFDPVNEEGLRRMAEAVESEDCRLLGAFTEPGRGSHTGSRNPRAVGPSVLPDDLSWTVPRALTGAEVRALVAEFAATAKRLRACGFSGVELSCGHGHLFHQFLSPWANRREDEYGGDVAGRTRLVRELVEAIRAECGADFIIGLKLPGDDGVPGGIDPAEAERIAAHLVAADRGDYFCFAQGAHARSLEMHVPDMHYGRLPYIDLTARVGRAAAGKPVVALGRITDPSQAERILREGKAHLVMMGRTLVADPAWPNKVREGREEEVRECLSCNTCWGKPTIVCVINPRLGTPDEATWRPAPAGRPRRVVVVGAGLAGLEAAAIARQRGHEVTVLSAGSEVGGAMRIHAALPGCDALANAYANPYVAAVRAGVRFELGRPVSAADVLACDPEAVVLATGARMVWPHALPEALRETGAVPHLRQACAQLLARPGLKGGTAVLYDHDHTAGTYAGALLLRERFDRVVLVTPREDLAHEENMVTRQGIYRRIHERGIEVVLLAEPVADADFEAGTVRLANVFTGRETMVEEVDLLTYATPRIPAIELAEPFRAAGLEVHLAGDAVAPRGPLDAIHDGHALGNAL